MKPRHKASRAVIPERLNRGSTSIIIINAFKWSWIPVFAGMTAAHAFFVEKGETGFEFLKMPVAARAVALGQAFTAVEGDITSIEYNPAGLTGFERLDINLSHQSYFEEATLNAVAIGYPLRIPILGPTRTGPNGYDAGNATVGVAYKQFHANDDRHDDQGIPDGELSINDYLVQGSMAYNAPLMSIGLSWKYLQNKIDQEKRNNNAFDIGCLFKPGSRWLLGAAILNMGPSKAFVEEKEALPTSMRLGAGFIWRKWNFLADVVQTRDKQTQPALGAEWAANPYVALRLGGRYASTFEPSGGIGVRLPDIGGRSPRIKPLEKTESKTATKKDGRKTLGQAGADQSHKSSENRIISLGLDYAIRSHEILGVVHSVTLKILY